MASSAAYKLKVCGVPEHFNSPFHLAAKADAYASAGLDVEWTDMPGGTGAMSEALETGSADVAVLLTEGMYKNIVCGAKAKIVAVYVQSPLCWGIHASAGAHHEAINGVADLRGRTFAISRLTSGSHLMAFVCAQQQGWDPARDLKFETVGNITGAREALKEDKAQAFMWEKFTTKPHVDSGEFKRVGECMTPWPCFVVAVRDELLAADGGEAAVLELLRVTKAAAESFQANEGGASVVYAAEKYGLETADVQEWLMGSNPVQWSCEPTFSAAVLQKIGATLAAVGVLTQEQVEATKPNDVLAKCCKLID